MKANDRQVGGKHYKAAIETWDYIIANRLDYLEGNAVKYASRWRKKAGVQDLQKCAHYIDKLIETEEAIPLAKAFDKVRTGINRLFAWYWPGMVWHSPVSPHRYAQAQGIGHAEQTVIGILTYWRKRGGIAELYEAKDIVERLIRFEKIIEASPVRNDF